VTTAPAAEAVPAPAAAAPVTDPPPEPTAEPEPAADDTNFGGAEVSGNPGFVKVTVDQNGCVGVWTGKPRSIVHLHSDEPARKAQVTVSGATAGFGFSSRSAAAEELSEAKGDFFELYAEESAAVISTAGMPVASFGADGTVKVPGKVHAESFESTSTRAAKTNIAPLSAAYALKLLDGLEAVQYEFKRSGDKHVGFIAEDVPDDVANAEHTSVKVMDIVSVLACCVKEQQKTIEQLTSRVAQLEARGSNSK